MDVKLIAGALRRRRLLVLIGLAASIALAIFAFVSISFSGGKLRVSYRESIQYGTTATLYLTQSGFPDGAAVQQFAPDARGAGGTPVQRGDVVRLSTLTSLLAQLADSDAVMRKVFGGPRPDPSIESVTVNQLSSESGQALPFLTVRGQSFDKARAFTLTTRASAAFVNYLRQRQAAAGIPESDRVLVDVSNRPDAPQLVSKRSLKLPMVVFLAALCATVGIALVVDNTKRQREGLELLGDDETVERLPSAISRRADGSKAAATSVSAARGRPTGRISSD